ncbi:MAG: bifunctional riboflavin kinase/FAD synthetase [Eubacteriales bacterium]|nr:bifunctional riboflavin kinase/FAD synthetase [Lachnospiraceae bacterium]MDO5127738.1 bifunctional riboflavin kinase/FAD synthetase [Eubacteriales bacterium]
MIITDYKKVNLNNTVVALGKFQGLHKGHMLLIDKIISLAKEHGYISTVFTINIPTKDKVLQLAKERFSILEEKGVDVAVECDFSEEFAAMTPERFVKEILIDHLHVTCVVVGEDFRFGINRLGDVDRLVEFGIKYGFRVIAFPKLKANGEIISASLIRTRVAEGKVDGLSDYLGRYYSVSGLVIEGKKLGRTIGFPTINLEPSKVKLLPQNGVYETFVRVDGVDYKAITNIGQNPTVDDDQKIHIETHIIDYSGDLYGHELTIWFARKLRDEKRFNSIEELKEQLKIDKMRVMHQ